MKRKSTFLLLISVPFVVIGFIVQLFSNIHTSIENEKTALDTVFEKAHADVTAPEIEGCCEGSEGSEGCGM